jgi:hypothetical protein
MTSFAVKDGQLIVKGGSLLIGNDPSCCCGVYVCATDRGCEGPLNSSQTAGYTTYPTLSACQEQCQYRGVSCDSELACGAPFWGPPGPPIGPPSCDGCQPTYICAVTQPCYFLGYRDIINNAVNPPIYTNLAVCNAECKEGYVCEINTGCVPSGGFYDSNPPPGTYLNEAACNAACGRVYACVPNAGCQFLGFSDVPGDFGSLEECNEACQANYTCDENNACVPSGSFSLNADLLPPGTYLNLAACFAVCGAVHVCDRNTGCQFVRFDDETVAGEFGGIEACSGVCVPYCSPSLGCDRVLYGFDPGICNEVGVADCVPCAECIPN